MNLKNRFRAAYKGFFKDSQQESKSLDDSNCTSQGLLEFLSSNGSVNGSGVSASAMWSWYKKIQPLRHAVEGIISPSFTSIQPAIFDTKNKEFMPEGDAPNSGILELLKKPNFDVSCKEFLAKLSPSHFVTGNVYLMVTAMDEESEPLELYYIAPQTVTPVQGSDGFTRSYMISGTKWNLTFNKKTLKDGSIRFVTEDGMKELWHKRNFNPDENDATGLTPIGSTLLEIEQYCSGNVHNNSVLDNGARPSGVLFIDPDIELSQEQVDSIKSQFEGNYQGKRNAGKVILAQGGKDFKEMSTSNKDMDFIEMMKRNTLGIYLTLNIPLPLVNAGSMTFSNYEEARFMLYDMTTIPFAEMIYCEIDTFLGRRYDTNDGQFILSFDKSKIQALDVRQNKEVERKIKSGVLSVNESRDLLDFIPVKGGDDVLQPANLVPVGETQEEDQVPKSRFIELMKYQKDLDGKRKYSDSEIEEKAKALYA